MQREANEQLSSSPSWVMRTPGILIIVVVVGVLLVPFAIQYFESSEYASVSQSISREKVSVDPRVLERYVGTYQLREGFVVEVTTLDGRLFAQATQQQRVEFHPATERVFFNDITPLLLKFEADADGQVQSFLALEPGRTRVATRIEDLGA